MAPKSVGETASVDAAEWFLVEDCASEKTTTTATETTTTTTTVTTTTTSEKHTTKLPSKPQEANSVNVEDVEAYGWLGLGGRKSINQYVGLVHWCGSGGGERGPYGRPVGCSF